MPLLLIFYFSVLYFDSSIYIKNFHLISATIHKHIIFFLRNGFFEVLCIIYSVSRNRRRNENLSIKMKLIRKEKRFKNKQTNKKKKKRKTQTDNRSEKMICDDKIWIISATEWSVLTYSKPYWLMVMIMTMNCYCGMFDPWKVFNLVSR